MSSSKLAAGSAFPQITVPLVSGGNVTLGAPKADDKWTLIVVYRGRHCPLCVKYLARLEELQADLNDKGADVVAVSGDGIEKAKDQVVLGSLTIPVAFGLTIEQMQEMGLYISSPRSPEETDQPFPEPGLFVLRPDGVIQILDISNAPFARPDLSLIARGIEMGREKAYPIRGTFE